MKKDPYDVALIGYGPVGAILANLLGRRQLAVAVIDQATGIYDKPRAINIDHEVMRILQSVDLADAVDRITSHHTGTEFRGMDDRLIKVFRPIAPPYPLLWAPNLMFIQPEFEAILRDGVERYPNVERLLGYRATRVEQDDHGVQVALENVATGEATALDARYVVACDGGASTVRRQLRVPQESLDFDEWWTVVDAWVHQPEHLPPRTTQFCLPSGPTSYVVGPRTLRRWELKVMPHERREDHADAEVVRKRLAPFVDPDTIDLWRMATYRFHALVAERWRLGRIFLAGDAAHQMPPFLAQGLCSGVRDAGNLAWKLAAVLQEQRTDTLLDSYEAERKPHIRQLVAITKQLGEIIGELDPERARVRDETLGAELESGRSETVRQKLIPDLTAGLIDLDDSGMPRGAAGALFPQPALESSGRLDDVLGNRFAVITAGIEAQRGLNGEAVELLSSLGAVRVALAGGLESPAAGVIEVRETGTLLADWFARGPWRAAIVRPDKYVFGTATDSTRLHALITALGQQMSAPPRYVSSAGTPATASPRSA